MLGWSSCCAIIDFRAWSTWKSKVVRSSYLHNGISCLYIESAPRFRAWRRGCLVTCCQRIAKPGNKTSVLTWLNPSLEDIRNTDWIGNVAKHDISIVLILIGQKAFKNGSKTFLILVCKDNFNVTHLFLNILYFSWFSAIGRFSFNITFSVSFTLQFYARRVHKWDTIIASS